MIHGLFHHSVCATRKLIATKFVWKGLQKQVGVCTKQCIPCQSYKIHTHTEAPLERFDIPHSQYDHIHVDLVGLLPPSNGYSHLLTVLDQFSHWPEAIPFKDTTTAGWEQALISTGCPVLASQLICHLTGDYSSPRSYGHT